MPTFLADKHFIEKLFDVNQFKVPDLEMIFIGVRGAITADSNDQSFKFTQELSLMDVNYINPRCTILQWNRNDDSFAAFPASTVPHQRFIKAKIANNGVGVNCLMTGFYTDYRKGVHKNGSPTGHEAFKQNAPHPIRRTADDADFENDDRIEIDNPFDNIHCGWFDGLTSDSYSSLGCQVIMGFPKCAKPGRTSNIGPWRAFHDNAYAIGQQAFPYVLITATDAFKTAAIRGVTQAKLRFGSSGNVVERLQSTLKEQHFYEGTIDGNYLERTLKAVIAFQKHQFGNSAVDGVVGPVTAAALQLDLSI